jgi:type IV secretory pathway VirB6-like protein
LQVVCKPIYCDVFQTKNVVNRLVEFLAVIGALSCNVVLAYQHCIAMFGTGPIAAQSAPARGLLPSAGGLWQTVLFIGIMIWLVIAFVARFEDHVYQF